MFVLTDGTIACSLEKDSLANAFTALRTANHSNVYAAASFWWTVGGGDFKPVALSCRRMPDPFLFTDMLTGHINSVAV
jgi:type VI secretion system protein ImpM